MTGSPLCRACLQVVHIGLDWDELQMLEEQIVTPSSQESGARAASGRCVSLLRRPLRKASGCTWSESTSARFPIPASDLLRSLSLCSPGSGFFAPIRRQMPRSSSRRTLTGCHASGLGYLSHLPGKRFGAESFSRPGFHVNVHGNVMRHMQPQAS